MKKETDTFTFWDSIKSRISRIGHNLRTLGDLISGTFSVDYEPEAWAMAEKRRNRIVLLIIGIVIIAILLIIGIPWINYYHKLIQQEISTSDGFLFIGSFWGAILGAAFAGLATIITTWLIIGRSYRIDFHRDRIDNLPILCIREIKGASYEADVLTLQNGTIVSEDRAYQEVGTYFETKLVKILEISNIGSNVALNIATKGLTDEHNEAYFPGITSKDIVYIILTTGPEFTSKRIILTFDDIFGNKYEQIFAYEFNSIFNMIFIGGSVPVLIERTNRIRYTQ